MKRDHFHAMPPRRCGRVGAALIAAALCGLIGAQLDFSSLDAEVSTPPALRPTFHESVFVGDRGASAAPDHALLSASDVERALPVPSRTAGMTHSVAS